MNTQVHRRYNIQIIFSLNLFIQVKYIEFVNNLVCKTPIKWIRGPLVEASTNTNDQSNKTMTSASRVALGSMGSLLRRLRMPAVIIPKLYSAQYGGSTRALAVGGALCTAAQRWLRRRWQLPPTSGSCALLPSMLSTP